MHFDSRRLEPPIPFLPMGSSSSHNIRRKTSSNREKRYRAPVHLFGCIAAYQKKHDSSRNRRKEEEAEFKHSRESKAKKGRHIKK
ncbi:hypothetical protein Y032_0332g2761 [Ancylostoma ceylanicum]|uniref:Uncharacterized protein n=1 Tax=Ancylostoma ceylanicum TaxID=53326 RepID=A0A016RZD0_9BILA|nr:hypothetical protein Y032_0332g2761 [Ancylostoma ceylanicum]